MGYIDVILTGRRSITWLETVGDLSNNKEAQLHPWRLAKIRSAGHSLGLDSTELCWSWDPAIIVGLCFNVCIR
jgi:hypothetical protein